MSHNASAHALRQRLPAMEKWLLFLLGDRADDWGGTIFMAYDSIAEKGGMSRSTLKRTFRELVKRGFVEIEVPATPVSPHFFRMVGVPAPVQVRQQDDTCPQALRRAAIYLFAQRCEFCRGRGMKEWGPDGKPWQVVQLEPHKYAGRPTADNVTLACQTCARKKHRSLDGVRSLVVCQRERVDQSADPDLFDEPLEAPDGRGQVDPSSSAGGGFILTPPRGQVDPREGSTWPGGGVKLTPDPLNDSCTDPSMDPEKQGAAPLYAENTAEKGSGILSAEEQAARLRFNAALQESRRTGARPDDLQRNVAVVTKLAHEVLDLLAETPDVTDTEITEAVKRRCAVLQIAYRSDVVSRAIESALFQRRRAGKPSVMRGSSGEAAARLQFRPG
jgi:hypothetical protein